MTYVVSEIARQALEVAGKDIVHAEHLPGAVYTSEEVLSREVDRIFRTDWLCVGREEEVAKSGDSMATKVVGEPVLVTRDEEGILNAFSNCVGTEVCNSHPKDAGTRAV